MKRFSSKINLFIDPTNRKEILQARDLEKSFKKRKVRDMIARRLLFFPLLILTAVSPLFCEHINAQKQTKNPYAQLGGTNVGSQVSFKLGFTLDGLIGGNFVLPSSGYDALSATVGKDPSTGLSSAFRFLANFKLAEIGVGMFGSTITLQAGVGMEYLHTPYWNRGIVISSPLTIPILLSYEVFLNKKTFVSAYVGPNFLINLVNPQYHGTPATVIHDGSDTDQGAIALEWGARYGINLWRPFWFVAGLDFQVSPGGEFLDTNGLPFKMAQSSLSFGIRAIY